MERPVAPGSRLISISLDMMNCIAVGRTEGFHDYGGLTLASERGGPALVPSALALPSKAPSRARRRTSTSTLDAKNAIWEPPAWTT